MILIYSIVCLSLFLFPQCKLMYVEGSNLNYSKEDVDPNKFDSEKCYEKCTVPDEYSGEEVYYEFTGDRKTEDVDLETINIVLEPARVGWEITLMSDGTSGRQLKEFPEKRLELTVLSDTTQSKNFRKIERKDLSDRSYRRVYRQVLCPHQITVSFMEQLHTGLKENGFEVLRKETSFGPMSHSMLNKFQQAKGLPIGHLDFETLEYLKIDF